MERAEAVMRFQKAVRLWNSGGREEALAALEDLLREFPGDVTLTRQWALWLAALGRTDQALSVCAHLSQRLNDPTGEQIAASIRQRARQQARRREVVPVQRRHRLYLAGAILCIVAVLVLGVMAYSRLMHPAGRTIAFPQDYSVGTVYRRLVPQAKTAAADWQEWKPAQGPMAPEPGYHYRIRLLVADPALANRPVDCAALQSFKPGELLEFESVDVRLGDAAAAFIGAHTGLKVLVLDNAGVTDAGVSALGNLTALTRLDLSGNPVTDAGMASLQNLHALEVLRAPSGLQNTSNLAAQYPGLKELDLGGTAIDESALDGLSSLASLRQLRLASTTIEGKRLADLAKLPALEELDLSNTRVNDATLRSLAGLKKLQTVLLGNTFVTGTGFDALAALTDLRTINLQAQPGRSEITVQGLKMIGGMKRLRALDLTGADLPILAVDELRRTLNGCTVTWAQAGQTLLAFPSAKSLGTVYVQLAGSPYAEAWAPSGPARGLVRLPEGYSVRFDVDVETSRDALACWLSLLARTPEVSAIRALRFDKGWVVDDETWRAILALPNLKELDCVKARLDGVQWNALQGAVNLAVLRLPEDAVPEPAFPMLARLPLTTLTLQNGELSQAMLGALASMASLKTLGLTGAPISPEAEARLRTALPGCQVLCASSPQRSVPFASTPTGVFWAGQLSPEAVLQWTPLEVKNNTLPVPAGASLRLDAVPGRAVAASEWSISGLTPEALYLPNATLEQGPITAVTSLDSVRTLDLFGNTLTDADAEALAKMPGLRQLRIASTSVTAKAITALATLTQLQELDLAGVSLQNARATDFAPLTNLKLLCIDGASLDLGFEDQLRQTLPYCQVVISAPYRDASPDSAPGARVLRVSAPAPLGDLFVRDWDTPEAAWQPWGSLNGEVAIPANKAVKLGVSAQGVWHLNALGGLPANTFDTVEFAPGLQLQGGILEPLARFSGLRELILNGVNLGAGSLTPLSTLDHLEVCQLFNARLSDRELAVFRSLPQLRELNLSRTLIDNEALAHLAHAPNPRLLNLRWCKNITDTGLAYLTRIPKLETLDLGFTRVSGEALHSVQRMEPLRHLDIYGTQVSPEDAVRMAQGRAALDIEHGQIHFDPMELAFLKDALRKQARSPEGLTRHAMMGLSGIDAWEMSSSESGRQVLRAALSAMADSNTGITAQSLQQLAGVDSLEQLTAAQREAVQMTALSAMADSDTGITVAGLAAAAGVETLDQLPEEQRTPLQMAALSAMANSDTGITARGLAAAAGVDSLSQVPEDQRAPLQVAALSAMADSDTGITAKSVATVMDAPDIAAVPQADRDRLRMETLSAMADAGDTITPKALTGWDGIDTIEALPKESLKRAEQAALSAMADSETGVTAERIMELAGVDSYEALEPARLRDLQKTALSAMADSNTGITVDGIAKVGGVASLEDLSSDQRMALQKTAISAMADSETGLTPDGLAATAGAQHFEELRGRDLPALQELALSAMADSSNGITLQGMRAITGGQDFAQLPRSTQDRLRDTALSAMAHSETGVTSAGLAAATGVETLAQVPEQQLNTLQVKALSEMAASQEGITAESIAAVTGAPSFQQVAQNTVQTLQLGVFRALAMDARGITPKALTGWGGVDRYDQLDPNYLRSTEQTALTAIAQSGKPLNEGSLTALSGVATAAAMTQESRQRLQESAINVLTQQNNTTPETAVAQLAGTAIGADVPEGERDVREISALTALADSSAGITPAAMAALAGASSPDALEPAARSRLAGHAMTALARARAPITRDRVTRALGGAVPSRVDWSGTKVTDQDLALLQETGGVRNLDLSGCAGITSEGMAQLAGLPLNTLKLAHTAVDDAGLAPLKAIGSLRDLDVSGTPISDKGLAMIAALPALTSLSLSETAIGDEGLALLANLITLAQVTTDQCPNVTGYGRMRYATLLDRAKLRHKARGETLGTLPRPEWFLRFAFAAALAFTNIALLYLSFLPLLIRHGASQRMVMAMEYSRQMTWFRVRQITYYSRWWIATGGMLFFSYLLFRILTNGYDTLMQSLGR